MCQVLNNNGRVMDKDSRGTCQHNKMFMTYFGMNLDIQQYHFDIITDTVDMVSEDSVFDTKNSHVSYPASQWRFRKII